MAYRGKVPNPLIRSFSYCRHSLCGGGNRWSCCSRSRNNLGCWRNCRGRLVRLTSVGANFEAGALDEGAELVGIICVSFWEFGGLVTVPDVLVAFVAPVPWSRRVISRSCFLFLRRIHNTNQQFYADKFWKKNNKQSTKGPTGRANLFTLNCGKQSLV